MIFEGMEFGSYDKAERKAHKAFEFYEDGKMSQALEELDGALEINPANSSWHFDKGLTLDAISRFDDAISEYEAALQLNPDDLEILNSLAVDYTRTGQYDLAIDTFEHIQELDADFEPCYCNRIITYTEMGQHDLAEQMFYLAQQINPDCALCYYNIGNSLFARGRYKKAIRCWLRTAELEPSHPQINYRIAQAYWSEADRDPLRERDPILQKKRKMGTQKRRMGTVPLKARSDAFGTPTLNERAREHFLAELRVNPGDVDVILDFGLFLLEAGDIESAKEKFNRALELKPDFAAALFYLGEIALSNGEGSHSRKGPHFAKEAQNGNPKKANAVPDYERAVELFNQALQKDNTLTGPCYRLAQYELMRGRRQKARVYLVSELQASPGDADVLVSMGSMFLTVGGDPRRKKDVRLGTSDLDYATNCLLRAVDIDSANADAYYYLGVVSANKGAFEDATEFFTHALDISSRHVPALRDSALVYLAMGRLADAAKRISKARTLAGDDRRLKALARRIWLIQARERFRDFLCRFSPRFILRKLPR